MTDESPSHTIQAPEKHVHLEDTPNGPSSQSMPVASVSTTASPLLSDTAANHVPEASSSNAELPKHNSDLDETLNETTAAAPPFAHIRESTSETTPGSNETPLVAPDSTLTKVGNDNVSTQAMPMTVEPEAEAEREVVEEKDPLGVVEGDVIERTQIHNTADTAEDEDEDTVAQDLKSPITSGSHKNSPPMHERDDSTDVGLIRSPQPWDLVDPPETNGRAEFYSSEGPKAYGSTPNKPCVVNTFPPSTSLIEPMQPTLYPSFFILFWTTTIRFRIWLTTHRSDRYSPSSRNPARRERLHRWRTYTICTSIPFGT
jgi:hypothetical protein